MSDSNKDKSSPAPSAKEDDDDNEDNEILKEMLTNNGMSISNLAFEGASCSQLEMFFSGYPKMVGLANFPNLEVLVIMSQTINKMDGLSTLIHLKELWISECHVKKIEGLDNLRRLSKLYLYSNYIERIEKLDQLKRLQILWLNDNNISVVEGLDTLMYLHELNLAENSIETLGESLNELSHLKKLELSGNQITSFSVLSSLAQLPSLDNLGLKTPTYDPNPVGVLCNYFTQVIYHLPDLQMLDGSDVTSKVIREVTEATVEKKKMYYHMKMKTLQRNLEEMLKRATAMRKHIMKSPYLRIRLLSAAAKEIDVKISELQKEDEQTAAETDSERATTPAESPYPAEAPITSLREKQKALKDRIKLLERRCAEVEYHYSEGVKRMRAATKHTVERLHIELHSGGNIRFQDGNTADVWFISCHDLMLSRFCAGDYKERDILGIKIHRITRVHNRALRNRFDEAIVAQAEEDDDTVISSKNLLCKNKLEYLFWIQDPSVSTDPMETLRILEDGFPCVETFKQPGQPEAIHLTNCLHLADQRRIEHLTSKTAGHRFSDACPFRFGQLLICKTYIGKTTECSDNKAIDGLTYPLFDSVFRPKRQTLTDDKSCECSDKQSDWFIFDHELVIPEYIIDFEYITRLAPSFPFLVHEITLLERRHKPLCITDENLTDDDVTLLPPVLRPRPKLMELPDDTLLTMGKAASLGEIHTLNLHGNCLSSLKGLSRLTAMRRLIVSFNELTRLEDLSHMALEYLDASFNQICTLEGFKAMNCMKHLDLSWNRLSNTRDDISVLRKHTPLLSTLDLQHNPWRKPENLRLRVIGRLKTLTRLDGTLVTDAEIASSLRVTATARISQLALLTYCRTDERRPQTMDLDTSVHCLSEHSRNRPVRSVITDNSWLAEVTCLNLDGQNISKISNLEQLTNLRWASFNSNHITKIEGLDRCCHLEELSLENNSIAVLEGMLHLGRLTRLHLARNYIGTIGAAAVSRMPALQYLDLESNQLSSLTGLEVALALTELYVGNNDIGSGRNVFLLKGIQNLMILDLYGNPIILSMLNYRSFVIYHLRALKALDGKSIESCEIGFAKDTFGGRLTQDFVMERMDTTEFNDILELDFAQSNIRSVDLGSGNTFINLRSINLENNNMTTFSGLIHLTNLRVLCLNHNHVESILARAKPPSLPVGKGRQPLMGVPLLSQADFSLATMPSLEVLHLGYNGIKDMNLLQLHRLPALKALFLQGNEIARVEGLEGVSELRELVLDRNKIKAVGELSFSGQQRLVELHLEENRVRDLSHLAQLQQLQRLFLGINRLQDLAELQKIEPLTKLVEISVVSNVVSRRMLHRPMLIFRMPQMQVIDGIAVTEEERNKVEMYFLDVQVPAMTPPVDTVLPGINNGYKGHLAMKVTNVQLNSNIYYDETVSQADMQRGVGRRRGYKTDLLQGLGRPKVASPLGSVFNAAPPSSASKSKSVPTLQQANANYASPQQDGTDNSSSENSKISKTPKR